MGSEGRELLITSQGSGTGYRVDGSDSQEFGETRRRSEHREISFVPCVAAVT